LIENAVGLETPCQTLENPLGLQKANPPPDVASGGFSVLLVLLEHVLERVENVPDLRFERCVTSGAIDGVALALINDVHGLDIRAGLVDVVAVSVFFTGRDFVCFTRESGGPGGVVRVAEHRVFDGYHTAVGAFKSGCRCCHVLTFCFRLGLFPPQTFSADAVNPTANFRTYVPHRVEL